MKIVGKTARMLVTVGGICAGLSCLLAFGFNHLLHNRNYIGEAFGKKYHCIVKPDGILSSRAYYGWDGRERVCQDRLGQVKTIVDGWPYGKHDGQVDFIESYSPFNPDKVCQLKRDEDYDEHKPEFDKASELLAETKERFKGFL